MQYLCSRKVEKDRQNDEDNEGKFLVVAPVLRRMRVHSVCRNQIPDSLI